MSAVLNQLNVNTLSQVANFQRRKTDQIDSQKRKELIEHIMYDIEVSAAKQIASLMKVDALYEVVEYLDIDHGDNNPHNRAVLQKRLKESLVESGIRNWLHQCKSENVLKHMARALEIRGFSTMGVKLLRKSIENELDIIGAQMVFGNLTLDILRDCCAVAKIPNFDVVNSKTPLLQALTCGIEIQTPQKTKKRGTRKPKFAQIEDCETYDQLFQHYLVDQLQAWCKENGVKSSGNKKTLINRILAYLSGDKENTMVDPARANRKPSSKPKAAPKEYPAPTRKSERKAAVVDEDSDEEMDDASSSAEEASDVMDEVVAPEATVEESESVAMELSSEDDSEHPSTLEGLKVALFGTLSKSKSEIFELIERNGGIAHNEKSISKDVDILVCANAQSTKLDKIRNSSKYNIKIVEEDFLRNLE